MFIKIVIEQLKINIVIAGRTYPLIVNTTEQEQAIRKAAKIINELIIKYEQNYAVNDKQDVLAMCALQFVSKLEVSSIKNDNTHVEAIEKINKLTNLLTSYLE